MAQLDATADVGPSGLDTRAVFEMRASRPVAIFDVGVARHLDRTEAEIAASAEPANGTDFAAEPIARRFANALQDDQHHPF